MSSTFLSFSHRQPDRSPSSRLHFLEDGSSAPRLLNFAALFLAGLLLITPRPGQAQAVNVQNGSTVRLSNGGVVDLEGGRMDLGDVGATARLVEEGESRVTGGQVEATRSLTAPSSVNVAGIGATLTAKDDLGDVAVTRGHAVQTGSGNASIARYYQIEPTGSNAGLDATLRLHYTDAELNGLDESTLAMFRSTDGGGSWEGAGQDGRDTEADVVTRNGVEAFSRWTLGSTDTPLPVEFASFTAVADDGETRLTWTTASERSNAGFEVQRRTGPKGAASAWTTLGFVESSAPGGTTSEQQSYTFADANLPYEADRLTYRLRQVDADGSARFSREVVVQRRVGSLELQTPYPNPVRHEATVRYAVPNQQAVTLTLYDLMGRRVRTVERKTQSGRHEVSVSATGLASGTYLLRLTAGKETRTERLTVVQ